jgi:hypothetical protein
MWRFYYFSFIYSYFFFYLGHYLKVLPEGINQTDFGAHSDFVVMLGPDMCGRNRFFSLHFFIYFHFSDNFQFIIKRNGTEFHSRDAPKFKVIFLVLYIIYDGDWLYG